AGDRHRAPLRRGDLAEGGRDQRHARAAPSVVMLSRGGVQGNCFRSMTMPVCNPGMKVVRLYCDEMLARLGRWLRAAGYDTAIAEGGLVDAEIIARCAAEDRTLLTRDRHLAAIAESRVPVVRLTETDLAGQARALRAALGID